MTDKLKTWWHTIAKFLMGQDEEYAAGGDRFLEGASLSKAAKRKQNLILALIFGTGLIGMMGWNMLTSYQS